MRVLGVNAVFHDPAAAPVVDGHVAAAAEEERFSRREHGRRPVPLAAWEQPLPSARWCLEHAGLNTAGRPMADDLRDALECFGSAPVSLPAIGPFVVRR